MCNICWIIIFTTSFCKKRTKKYKEAVPELAAEVSYPVSEIVIGGAMFLR
jgi:hypothetical protein